MNLTTEAILNDDENLSVLEEFFRDMLKGCKNSCYSRIYLDLDDGKLFSSAQPCVNNRLVRDDDSLAEITGDAGWGADLSEDELEWLDVDGVQEFGYSDWLNNTIEPAIQEALDYWQSRAE
ncbi:MAG: hypothetical protein Q4B94_00170 [Pseudomonadota bacterium]|nr:hypothetical protein [Pseudomonadota bacterium]